VSVQSLLRGGLIVSVQAWPGSAIDDPYVIAAMALAAERNGAAGVRVQGAANLRAVRDRVSVPIVGLIKREVDGFEPYITPEAEDVRAVLAAEAEIVAFDATVRARPAGASVAELIGLIRKAGRLAMADCATFADARAAVDAGADIIATTLCGYTAGTKGTPLPALELVREIAAAGAPFVVCEGGVQAPAQAASAVAAGADAVVVGTAITNIDWLVREFAGSVRTKPKPQS
jgi:N-acylglucosamine-6-phosphate 2-epimerase